MKSPTNAKITNKRHKPRAQPYWSDEIQDLVQKETRGFYLQFYGLKIRSFVISPLTLIQEEQLSVNGEMLCAKYWLPASGRLAQEHCG